jgi:hypothetical protein
MGPLFEARERVVSKGNSCPLVEHTSYEDCPTLKMRNYVVISAPRYNLRTKIIILGWK